MHLEPSPVVALNRAVAIATHDGPEAGLNLLEPLLAQLPGYYAASATAADLCRCCGRLDDARVHYLSAIALVRQQPERLFLLRRLTEMSS